MGIAPSGPSPTGRPRPELTSPAQPRPRWAYRRTCRVIMLTWNRTFRKEEVITHYGEVESLFDKDLWIVVLAASAHRMGGKQTPQPSALRISPRLFGVP